ncbi:hypothetical protein [Kribbella sp.]|uniref:hypothetical protein n=1 Tax=Kribbella sp. TaxID=1871183 RepID=UPI002D24B638|nr:hypothetical protein [Kribbella sp.]HZX02813.1 hypothetical protein [Kribbella sp.]
MHVSRRSFVTAAGAAALPLHSTHQATAAPMAPRQVSALTLEKIPAANPTLSGLRAVADGQLLWECRDPLVIDVKVGDAPARSTAGYTSLAISGTAAPGGSGVSAIGIGEIRTPSGGRYAFRDEWRVVGSAVSVTRKVTAVAPNPLLEMGFASSVEIVPGDTGPLAEQDLLLPAVRAGGTTGLGGGIAGNDAAEWILVREMRLSLPFVALRNRRSGRTLRLAHVDAAPRTATNGLYPEDSNAWWIHEDVQFASLGVHQTSGKSALALAYPGSEGDVTYLGGQWARRSHPARAGFTHTYQVRITASTSGTFATAARDAWRDHWNLFKVTPLKDRNTQVHDSGLALLDAQVARYNGKPGLPFRSRLDSGEADAVSYMMGFVGQQVPAGFQLLRSGLLDGDPARLAKGKAILDFWATESPLPNGLVRLWIDGDQPSWRDWYQGFVRVASDGMDGMVDACRLMRDRGEPVATWEQAVTGFADFLVGKQYADGSFARSYNRDGSVASDARTNTSHPIRFLCHTAALTGNDKYRNAAVRAGQWYVANTKDWQFIGGTADNPNVLDKEAGGMAFNAALALHDLTGEDRWLDLAKRAADFTETWLVAWRWRIDTPRRAYARDGAFGLSFIASGHSGIDNWICYQSWNFYRLFLFTGDTHYRDVATTILTAGVRTTELPDQPQGYAVPGLVEEAVGLSDLVVSGSNVWLPWCTVAEVEPLSRFLDTFGTVELRALEAIPLADRQRANRAVR